MTIAVACNLADGVVLGVDSAITIHGTLTTPQGEQQTGVLKVYNEAEKLFPLFDRYVDSYGKGATAVGVATYGLAVLNLRSIESYIREFEHHYKSEPVSQWPIQKIAENLWKFFNTKYRETFEADLEEKFQKPFDEIEPQQRPGLGLLVGGFSPDEYLSELWDVIIHSKTIEEGVKQTRAPGNFGGNWRGQIEGIRRFHKGFSYEHLELVIKTILEHLSVQQMDKELHQQINSIVESAEYVIPWGGMPLQEGIEYVKFCLDIMINQTKFIIGAPTCGGNTRIAIVQREKGFNFITDTNFRL